MNAVPVPIVDGNGNPVMQNGVRVMLQDVDDRITGEGCGNLCYFNGEEIVAVDSKTTKHQTLYLSLSNDNYVEADSLENDAIKQHFREYNVSNIYKNIKTKIHNLILGAKLPIEWKNIYNYKNILKNRCDIVEIAFNQLLSQAKTEIGEAIINDIKNDLLYIKPNKTRSKLPEIQYIIDQYTILKICFISSANANEAIKRLLLMNYQNTDEGYDIITKVRERFLRHIPKHFCDNNLMVKCAQEFKNAKIDEPQDGHDYTSLSYNVKSFDSVKQIAKYVLPQVVSYLNDNCTFDFTQDANKTSFTIRLTSVLPQCEGTIETKGDLQAMYKLNYKKLTDIFKYKDNSKEIIPDIFCVKDYQIRGGNNTIVLAQHDLEECYNKLFYIFFNIGFNLKVCVDCNELNEEALHGSLFPVEV